IRDTRSKGRRELSLIGKRPGFESAAAVEEHGRSQRGCLKFFRGAVPNDICHRGATVSSMCREPVEKEWQRCGELVAQEQRPELGACGIEFRLHDIGHSVASNITTE